MREMIDEQRSRTNKRQATGENEITNMHIKRTVEKESEVALFRKGSFFSVFSLASFSAELDICYIFYCSLLHSSYTLLSTRALKAPTQFSHHPWHHLPPHFTPQLEISRSPAASARCRSPAVPMPVRSWCNLKAEKDMEPAK